MAVVSLPSLPGLFERVEWTLDVPQQANRSEFSRRTQVVGQPGSDRWMASATVLPDATEAEVRAWRAFILSCRGAENTFNLPAPKPWPTPSAEPTVTAAVTGDRAVVVSSAAQLQIGMLATVQQANGKYRLVGIVGLAGTTVYFEPELGGAPATAVALKIIAPFCPMRLSSKVSLPQRATPAGFKFEAEEAL